MCQEALDEVGIKTMAEAITLVSFEEKAAQTRLGHCLPTTVPR